MYDEVNAFFNRPTGDSLDDPQGVQEATRIQFLSELKKINQSNPPSQARMSNQADLKLKSNQKDNSEAKQVDFDNVLNEMPGGMSCLDEFQTSQMNSVMDPTKQTQFSAGTPHSRQNEDVENPSTHKDLEILQNYRQTKAFQTLMRRQAQAVRKITRIKETFTKKREQITMLNVAYKTSQDKN